MSIHADRRIIVNNIYDEVAFPESVTIMETNGWEHSEGGTERLPVSWNRILFLENPTNPDGDSISATLSITFYPNSVEVESVTLDGAPLKVPAPY